MAETIEPGERTHAAEHHHDHVVDGVEPTGHGGVERADVLAKIPPAMPAKNAEIAKTSTLRYVVLSPEAPAAISSSRMP